MSAPSKGVPGLVVLVGIVVLGMGSGAAYFHYKAPRLKRDLERQIEAAPKTPEGRVAAWHVYGAPNIHRRIAIVGRFSEEYPWLVTHAYELEDGGLELWGVDCQTLLPGEVSHVEGMRIVVDLPHPSRLGVIEDASAYSKHLPRPKRGDTTFDADQRLRQLALFFLEGMPAALAKDIEGAELEVRIGEDAGADGGDEVGTSSSG